MLQVKHAPHDYQCTKCGHKTRMWTVGQMTVEAKCYGDCSVVVNRHTSWEEVLPVPTLHKLVTPE